MPYSGYQVQKKITALFDYLFVIVALSTVGFIWVLLINEALTLIVKSAVVILLLAFIGGLFYCRKLLTSKLTQYFSPYCALENWANLSKLSGKYQSLESQGEISQAITQLQNELHHVKHRASYFDQSIRESALLDIETGIGNREFFSNRLEAFLREEDAQGIVLLIQFNDIELIQTLYGQSQVSSLLEELVQCVKQRLQFSANYFIARRGEFEIAILLPHYFAQDVSKLCERLLSSLQKITLPVGINHEEFIHIGVSYFTQNKKPYQVMAEADMALRSAQLHGPSQWFMYESGEVENHTVKGSLKWRTLLSQAIKNNAFVIFFQPVMARHADKIIHHEALAKVRDTEGELISARIFLPMAQKCGLSPDIDMLVFEHITRLLQYEYVQHDDCSMNLSLDALLSDKFKTEFLSKISRLPDVATRLIVEISEYYLATHLANISSFIIQLNDYGVRVLADKVGQYIVSASYLSEVPISYIKLHRSIVLGIQDKTENQVFVQSMKTMCERYQVMMLALGVEQQEEWQMLLRLGVSGGQGHFFTEPVEQVAKAIHLP